MNDHTVWVGWDEEEMRAAGVATWSIREHGYAGTVRRVSIADMRRQGLYQRPTTIQDGRRWDLISAAPMSTGHAIARFLVPHLQQYQGWAVFVDGDILALSNLHDLFALADPRYAVQVVQHAPMPNAIEKKAGHAQVLYHRKNWSSVILWNCAHPAHLALDLARVNSVPGRDLHRFDWLEDDQIGALPAGWNYLVGVTEPEPTPVHIAHYTLGTPDTVPVEDRWRDAWTTAATQAGYVDYKRVHTVRT